MYEGAPPTVSGHSTYASSYFDRLWMNGDKDKRYFFTVTVVKNVFGFASDRDESSEESEEEDESSSSPSSSSSEEETTDSEA